MTEIFTTEVILTTAILGNSLLVTIMGFLMMREPKDDRPKVDIDAVVRNAPYHLLEGTGIKVEGACPND
ncbi:hypothetical protein PSM7751_03883 [Pseudooceanicola marinus]|uniref:Uncharacterized protein n=1 Tax=Pseudooceanicola marinus TaxID=396013 RepID=A0A1X7A6X6_9RHOB|nr:hypothetical protein [Pseudooceanicola marinus]PJE33692.1 hypothetical protein CVM50_00260 [Pseudooceanicola marinus]SLN71880.1 hypothetical protein PSM7751_03883 [Pseudooceanicola marinus]